MGKRDEAELEDAINVAKFEAEEAELQAEDATREMHRAQEHLKDLLKKAGRA